MTPGNTRAFDAYQAIGEWYDAEHDPVVEDVELYLQLAEVVGDPILELGCGSGRILAPLANAGHRVTGVDQSTNMLRLARRRLAGIESAQATLVESPMDVLTPELRGRHGLVILSHNTLLHAEDSTVQRAVLTAARAALDPRGMLVVDLINPLVDLDAAAPGRVIQEGSWPLADGASVTKLSCARVTQATQTIVTDIWYDHVDRAGQLRRVTTQLTLRYVSAAELLLMLELTGFSEPQLYGDYDLEPYTDGSPRIVVTAEATRSG